MTGNTPTDPTQDLLAQFAPTGKLRFAINHGNPVLAQVSGAGELGGASVAVARELAARLEVRFELVPFDAAGKAFKALSTGECDVGFLAIDPERGTQIDYTAAYVLIEGAYLVRSDSPYTLAEQVDQPGVRIASSPNTAYDLHLRRELKHASLVHAPRSPEAMELFLRGDTDAVAGIRQPLAAVAQAHPGLRVTQGSFMAIRQAMAMPNGREHAMSFLRGFVEDVKASGLVRQALDDSGQADAQVAEADPSS
ncbi:ABC transporter substrate-binding protein [Roseomonas chloroacetimidivorans]|uniref:ABC transporter substrate-binding protein n=1 Tax=Roseomonas chloroacetimidivorans TaxID=1766656 RepID=UPI003C70AB50